ncbi:MAG: hypothetical protein JJ974_09910 [Phycisphaerales bacterium]|nr:hypothetical protein [Phycisphaerales bacterium]
MKLTQYDFGLEIIEGLPGSGKSFYATRRIIRAIKKYKRPVYTNLPLIFPVVRKYLRIIGGEELANLIRPLKEDHWKRFLRRQHAFARFKEQRAGHPRNLPEEAQHDLCKSLQIKHSELLKQPKVTPDQMVAWFNHKVGQPVYTGSEADSIPLSSIIVIDEVQHWHPMIKQGNAEGREELQAYLTMMRHHLHWIWVITQDRTRIDIIFRKLCKSVWQVWDRGEDRLAFGIRFHHLGLRAMGYRRYTPEQLEGTNRDNQKPSETFMIFPWLPWEQINFRLYTSWTQAGSKRQIQKTLERVRKEAGVNEHTGQRRKHLIMRRPKFITGIYNMIHKLMLCGTCVALGLVISNMKPPAQEKETRDQPTAQPVALPEPHDWPTYDGFAGTKPILNGQVLTVGDSVGARGRLAYIHAPDRSLVVIADNGYWLWEYGTQRPNPVGPVDQIRAAFRRLQEADHAAGRTIPDDQSDTGQGMGT